MRIIAIQHRNVAVSRYEGVPPSPEGLTTSVVAITTDVVRGGKPIVGLGFSSIGRFGQSGLIGERFAPRLLRAMPEQLLNDAGDNIVPFRAWRLMMADEKPGGHGERCVAVGTLDMALWDAAAKIADQPLWMCLASRLGRVAVQSMPIYASGGYMYAQDDQYRLVDEIKRFIDLGHTRMKIKIGAAPLQIDLARIDAVIRLLPSPERLAVDAMNRYGAVAAQSAAIALQPYGLHWFEDICEPLDYELQARLVGKYEPPIAAGEPLFSSSDALNLLRYGGLRPGRDRLVFDPVHCYGVSGYLEILSIFDRAGWSRTSHWPHGGHLFCLHLAAALALGGVESNPSSFAPFGGIEDVVSVSEGRAALPQLPGIGFEARADMHALFNSLGS